MRLLYGICLSLLLPVLLVRLAWRGLGNRDYLRRWGERLGYVERLPDDGTTVWVHAVSVGEVQAALPLVGALRSRHPRMRVLLTTMTPTGSRALREVLGDDVHHCYAPYDTPGAVARFSARVAPALAVVMETELWPNLIHACAVRGAPVVVANARLSARSAAGYRRLGSLTRGMLDEVSAVGAQAEADARRLVELGLAPARAHVTGSVKFDVRLSALVVERGQALRRRWGTDRNVWVAASTHEGEEALVLDAFTQVRARVPDCLLVLVPRHPERFDAVAALSRRRGFATARRTAEPADCRGVEVYIGDTMGELTAFYAGADLAFVGGSLVPTGGHNVLEPAALGVPVVNGPHRFNFEDITRRLLAEDAAEEVADANALAAAVTRLLLDADRRHAMGERGRRFVQANRGALERLVELVESHLPRALADAPAAGRPGE